MRDTKYFQTFLDNALTMVLATVKKGKYPRASTLFFAADNDHNLYFVSSSNSQKVKNINENSNVAAVIESDDASVNLQIDGKAKELKTEKERSVWFDKLAKKIASNSHLWPPIFHISSGSTHKLYKIETSEIISLDLKDPKIKKKISIHSKVK